MIARNIYRLFAVWEVRTEKYFPEVLEAARDRRSRTLLRPRENIFQYGPTWTVNNLFIFFDICFIKFQCCEFFLRSVVFVTFDNNLSKNTTHTTTYALKKDENSKKGPFFLYNGDFLVNKQIMKVNGLKNFHFHCYFPIITCLNCSFDMHAAINLLFDKHLIFYGFKCIKMLNSAPKLCLNRLSKYIFSISLFQIRFYILIFVFIGEFLRIYICFLNTASRDVCIFRNFCLFSCILLLL